MNSEHLIFITVALKNWVRMYDAYLDGLPVRRVEIEALHLCERGMF